MPLDHATDRATISRRSLLKVAGAVGTLTLGFSLPWPLRDAHAATAASFAPNAFIRIDPAGQVTLVMPYVEMGQGTYTSIPMLLAEELEVGLDQLRLEHAPADDKLYANPLLGFQATGGSTAIRASWEPMRRAGAAARMMLISAAAATWKIDAGACHAESGAVIDAAGTRKLGYGALAEKAATLPVPQQITLKDPRDFKIVGKPAKRLDTPEKVNGKAAFGIDTRLPGMKIATVASSPVFGGKLARLDDSKAKAVKGVHQVVRLDEAVAVVADHMGAAKKGLAALEITWDDGANAHVATADLVREMDAASQNPGVVDKNEGDVAAALAGAATKLEAIYQVPFLAHAPMEPMNCTVHVAKDRCDVWVGTQIAGRARAVTAELTSLPVEKVEIHNHLIGGGFGRRLDVDGIALAVRIAKEVDGPVKVVWTREEDIQHDIYRPYYYDRLAGGLDAAGKVVAWSHRVTGSSVLARWLPPAFKDGHDFDAVEAAMGPYSFPNAHIDYVRHEPPAGLLTGWWRGVGVTHNAFMVEGFIDELAVAAKKDPVEFRRGLLENAPRARGVLDLAASKAGWGSPMPAGKGRGVSVIFGFGTYVAQVAEVSVAKDGQVRVDRVVCAVDCGRVVNPDTVKAQIEGGAIFGITAVLYGEITLKNGRVEQSNFDSYQMLRIDEAPAIEVYIVDSTEAPGGMGEPSTATIGPAVVNAVHAATGVRLRQLPIDPTKLKSA